VDGSLTVVREATDALTSTPIKRDHLLTRRVASLICNSVRMHLWSCRRN
jgi:hypothetical protein